MALRTRTYLELFQKIHNYKRLQIHLWNGTINYQKNHYSNDVKKLEYKQVYYGILTPQIKAVKFFSLSSSFVGIISQPFLYKAVVSTGNIPVIIAAYSFLGFFTFITPFLLHFITKKYVTHLGYCANSDTYQAKVVNFFCMEKQIKFKPEDVKVPEVPGMFTTLIVNGKSLFLDPRLFENPQHYSRLMGYDKPIDFKLFNSDVDKKD